MLAVFHNGKNRLNGCIVTMFLYGRHSNEFIVYCNKKDDIIMLDIILFAIGITNFDAHLSPIK